MALFSPLHAQDAIDPWDLCPAPSSSLHPHREVSNNITHILAEKVETSQGGVSTFEGNVSVERGDTYMEAERAVYDRNNESLQIDSEIYLETRGGRISGDSARLNLRDNNGEIRNARFEFPEIHGSGEAGRFSFVGPEFTRLDEVNYSTCPPQKQDWLLKAKSLELDQTTNTGEARHVTLRFKKVPFFYFPYLNFPLQGRKTGLLAPTIGRSETNGTELSTPFYWNIAPHRDATFTPRYIQNRGTMLNSEFRYLNPESVGKLNFDYLDSDALYNDEKRYAGHYDTRAHLGEGWSASLLYNKVSDPLYFDDLGGSQALSSQTHLERHAEVRYLDRNWSLLARAQGYQTISGTEPYQRLPQIRLNGNSTPQHNRLRYTLASELVNFHTDDDSISRGTRLDLYPAVSLPLGGSAWYLTPRAGYRYTQYQLENAPVEDPIHRGLPVYSLDSGIFFERDLRLGGIGLQQTLEPRLYYLHVPYENQDEIPLFDTYRSDFTFDQLFSDNRFNGADRQGDADQLTLALTSRLLSHDTGAELLRGSIGQILYFEDREVTLDPADLVEEQSSSELVAELVARTVKAVEISTAARWNPDTEKTEVATAKLRYRPADGKVISAGYRYRREEELRQAELAAFWPVSRQWRLLGRWHYDLGLERTLDIVSGFEYESCCWGLQIVGRGQLNTTTDELEHSIYLNLELKGLSSVGRALDSEVERVILGE